MTIAALVSDFRQRLAARDRVVGINRRNVDLVYANNPRKHFPYADDKILAKRSMAERGVAVPATLAECRGLFEVEATLATLEPLEQFVVKPASGSGGNGILVVGRKIGEGCWERSGGRTLTRAELRKHLADIVFGAYSKQMEDQALVEPRIVGHPVFQRLWGDGLCDVRVIVLRDTPVAAMVRVPTRESGGRANLHQGGLGLAVDLGSGKVVRAYHHGRSIERHPESGAELIGLEVPGFAGLLEVARAAATSVPLDYLGVDLVVDEDGRAYVLEINARPGIEIQNVHGRGLAMMISEAGEHVVPPSRRSSPDDGPPGREGESAGRARLPVGDRLWPVLTVLVALLSGAIAVEVMARGREPDATLIEIHSSADATAAEDDGAPEGEAPPDDSRPVNPAHERARTAAHRGEVERAISAYREALAAAPTASMVRVELGYWLILAHRAAEARDELALAATELPAEPRVALYSGHALAALHDDHAAEREYRRALAMRPGYGGARIALARLLLRKRRFEDALSIVEPATRSGGNDERARALVVYGAVLIRLGRRQDAERAFTRAIERAPAHAELRIRIGRAWLESDDRADAARAIRAFDLAARLSPDLATAHSGLARAYEQAGDEIGAMREYERCLQLDPGYTFARRRLLRIALANRDFRRARLQAEHLLAQDDTDPEHHFLAGLVAAREGHSEEARERYRRAIDVAHGDYPEAYFNLAQLESRAGRRDDAIAAYEKAIERRPRYTQAMNNLGLVYESAGRDADAEGIYRRALAIDPDYAAALVNLGSFLSHRGRHEEAIASLERAVRVRHGRHAPTDLELARALARAGHADAARATLERLVERDARYASGWIELGRLRAAAGDVEAAVRAFEHAVELDPDNVDAMDELGRAEARQGSLTASKQHLVDALDHDAARARTRLALADVLRRLGDPNGCRREASVAGADASIAAQAQQLRGNCSRP